MILENGVIRTLDPSLPEARALAIAGDRIAGGVGVHETALPSPDDFSERGLALEQAKYVVAPRSIVVLRRPKKR